MKNLIITIFLGVTTLFSSCTDYLSVSDELAGNLTIEETFQNVKYTKGWYGNVFNCISEYSNSFFQHTGLTNPWTILAGETTTCNDKAKVEIQNGFNASNASFHRFGPLYQYIRQGQIFLENAQPIGEATSNDVLTELDIKQMKSEVKFLIAYSYFSLFELYGPCPIVIEIADPNNKNLDFERPTVDEMVAHIDGLLQEVLDEDYLPHTLRVLDPETGISEEKLDEMVRPTRAVVLALRAKLWVYAASKLFNGGFEEALQTKNKDGKSLFPIHDANKWVTAKTHLKTFLDFAQAEEYELYTYKNANGSINPGMSVYNLFQEYNNEIIWATSKNDFKVVSDRMERRCIPASIFDGYAGVGVSQDMVDAFFVKDGLTIHDGSPLYSETGFSNVNNPCRILSPKVDKNVYNMYANREPRFYHSITYTGKSWHIDPRPNYTVDFAKGGADQVMGVRSNYTGYLMHKKGNNKMLNKGSNLKSWARPSILLRLADFYLYYAEVCNEINPNDPEIINYLDKVRERAGIPGYRELQATGKKIGVIGNYEMQGKMIRQERKVELFHEGQRYFDIRRWMICGEGEEADHTSYMGMDLTGSKDIAPGKTGSFFNRVVAQKHIWRKEMYLYPIPHGEIEKSNKLVQNPLW